MNFKRIIITLLAALLLPGLALAQTSLATFEVNKIFSDENPGKVWVTLDCFNGNPIVQRQEISATRNVVFVMTNFESGALDCNVTEDDVDGYTGSAGCQYTDVVNGAENVCDITNTVNDVNVTVSKEWVIEGTGGDTIDPAYEITLVCDGHIGGGKQCKKWEPPSNGGWGGYHHICQELPPGAYYKQWENESGLDNADYTADVTPDWDGGTQCSAWEETADSYVESDQADCNSGFTVHVGDADGADGCTIINSVFFEGIPTLSQYGMAIMALLMLGVGFVGFRRFV